jgi:hypothetical protein
VGEARPVPKGLGHNPFLDTLLSFLHFKSGLDVVLVS